MFRTAMMILFAFISAIANGQAVTEIVTNYNGYWRTGHGNISPVKPDNHHELISFSYNGTRYSTGVNDALLSSNGLAFTPGLYNALPMTTIGGAANGNTKIGLGALVDGVANGAGPAPARTLGPYLNDGINGLDMGTCVANLPAGTMFLSVSNIQAAKIGDGIPDILVTQIADPSTSYDSYEFTDINGTRVGSPLNVVLNTISPVGQWMADFYEATGATILSSGYTQTQRDIRLWAADFTTFGINASNISNVAYFKITLSGTSDIAFVAYNSATITVQAVLSMRARQRLSRTLPAPVVTDLSVFPNPATDVVNLTHPTANAADAIFIFSVNGSQVSKYVPEVGATQTKIPVKGLPPGVYQVLYTCNQRRLMQKLVIK
ncbi:MAG: T9SS type A sorting domain-containing protein [Chitinophagaceae bacterium]|nr:T9SS type A sorting domain-containing protein [Chitinophagaceae bacterium]